MIKKQKMYEKQIREKINTRLNEFFRKTKDLDLNFKIACNLRSRTSKAFISQNSRKTNKTFDLLGCSHSFFKRLIIHELYRDITLEK